MVSLTNGLPACSMLPAATAEGFCPETPFGSHLLAPAAAPRHKDRSLAVDIPLAQHIPGLGSHPPGGAACWPLAGCALPCACWGRLDHPNQTWWDLFRNCVGLLLKSRQQLPVITAAAGLN